MSWNAIWCCKKCQCVQLTHYVQPLRKSLWVWVWVWMARSGAHAFICANCTCGKVWFRQLVDLCAWLKFCTLIIVFLCVPLPHKRRESLSCKDKTWFLSLKAPYLKATFKQSHNIPIFSMKMQHLVGPLFLLYDLHCHYSGQFFLAIHLINLLHSMKVVYSTDHGLYIIPTLHHPYIVWRAVLELIMVAPVWRLRQTVGDLWLHPPAPL